MPGDGGVTPAPRGGGVAWALRVALALFALNLLLSFENLPPAGVRFGPRLSFELCVGVLGLAAWVAWRGRAGARLVSALAWAWVALAAVRYLDVTVPAAFGRPVNLYWDAPHAVELLRLAAGERPGWQVAAALAGGMALALAALIALQRAVRLAIGVLADALRWPAPRPAIAVVGAALVASFAAYPYVGRDTRWFFALPVMPTIARQATLLPAALSRPRSEARLGPGPDFAGNVAALHGADVLLLFSESYGATTLDDPRQAAALAAPRARLAAALRERGRQVVSARVRSPTYGGGSWLAHAALLAGIDTHDPDDNDLLLTTQRPTLVRQFAQHGYRTVAWMPGIQRPWPEGRFYGFDRIADAAGIGYAGPEFGYWRIPDQASMALLHAQELALPRPRAPRFIVFPTVTTHAPFRPVAPLRAGPAVAGYTVAERDAALAQPVSWTAPVPAYLESIAYSLDWLAAYLRTQAADDLVLIVLGDHQPYAGVTGPGASWDVPVHVIAPEGMLLQRLRAAGFVDGLLPASRTLGAMQELTGVLLRAFDQENAGPPRVFLTPTGGGRGAARLWGRSAPAGVDVAGRRRVAEAGEPSAQAVGIDAARGVGARQLDEAQALAQRHLVAVAAQRLQPVDAGERAVAGRREELEGQRR